MLRDVQPNPDYVRRGFGSAPNMRMQSDRLAREIVAFLMLPLQRPCGGLDSPELYKQNKWAIIVFHQYKESKMAEIKTKVNDASVEEFLSKVEDEQKRQDCFEIVKLMKQVTKKEPKMWGPAIIGFGSYHYKYESGREGDMPQIAFSPRKQNLTLYIGVGDSSDNPLLKKLGKYTTGKVCLYIKKLADVDRHILQELIADSFERAP